jgi:membrane dipeptidase
MIIIDSHLDLSWNALGWNRDLELAIVEIRRSETGMQGKGRGKNTVSLPELRRGNVAVCLATVLARCNRQGTSMLDFRCQQIAYAVAQGQLAYYRILEKQQKVRILKDLYSLENHLAKWKSGRDTEPLGFITAMEGADPIISPAQVSAWWEDGLRVLGLAHYGLSAYAHGTASSGGLTPKGRELLRAMQDVGMILDLTHLADESFWEALDCFSGPVLASHTNCRALVPGDRQFDDDQIRAVISRGGVIGTAFDAWMLVPNWKQDSVVHPRVTLEHVVDHMDHICQIAGNAQHVAIGSDLDGGYGTEQCPEDLDTIADLQKIAQLLRRRGYSAEEVESMMHGNWMRFFRSAWGAMGRC